MRYSAVKMTVSEHSLIYTKPFSEYLTAVDEEFDSKMVCVLQLTHSSVTFHDLATTKPSQVLLLVIGDNRLTSCQANQPVGGDY
jgi:hypothetical protein